MEAQLNTKELEERGVDIKKLSFLGSLNYMVQIFKETDENGDTYVEYDVYQPRKNRIYHNAEHIDESRMNEIRKEIAETIERMKIAEILLQDFLDGKRNDVYYWQGDDEDTLRNNDELKD